jgi:hypothetical protein
LETAGTWSLLGHVSGESDVSLLSPSSTPGVLDDPEVFSVLGSITNGEDTMVEGSSTESLEDSSVVELPSKGSGINSNGDWSNVEGFNQGSWGVDRNILEGFDLELGISGGVVASSVGSGVWVGSFSVHLGTLSVLEGEIHKTTLASVVSEGSGAVNKLLLGKRNEVSSRDLVGSLHGSSGRE